MDFYLNYRSVGIGTPFVFQHGLGANLQQAQNLLPELKQCQLISMDCRGHGQSPLKKEILPSFDHYADDLIRLLDHLELDSAIFGGISMGAGLAMNIARRYPRRVKALVLVRPAWLDQPRPANLEILLQEAEYINSPNGQHRFAQTEPFQSILTELPRAAQSLLGQFTREQGEYTPLVLQRLVGDAPIKKLEELKKIDKPCLIIVNEDDPLHPAHFGQVIQQYIPGSRLKTVVSRYRNDALHQQQVQREVSSFIDNYRNLGNKNSK